jgi:N-acetyl-anhydromuramyl-L-alanine amidase AmpD
MSIQTPKPKIDTSLAPAKILLTRLLPIIGIVLHDTAGTGKHNDTLYLRNSPEAPKRKVSVDFTVERDGHIYQLNPDLDKRACAHAGRATALKGFRNGDVTRRTIGIEICQSVALPKTPASNSPEDIAAHPYTGAQVRAVAELCAYLADRYKLVSADITTHRNIITDGSRTDPRSFPFTGAYSFWHYFWSVKGKGENFIAAQTEQKTPDIG